MVRSAVPFGAAWAPVATTCLLLAGCGVRSNVSSAAAAKTHVTEEASLQYRNAVAEVAALSAQYVRHWEQTGTWPDPGTYNTDVLIYKGTEADSPTFPNRRRDFYRTLFAGGRELDVIMYDDGRLAVNVFQDREPVVSEREE